MSLEERYNQSVWAKQSAESRGAGTERWTESTEISMGVNPNGTEETRPSNIWTGGH